VRRTLSQGALLRPKAAPSPQRRHTAYFATPTPEWIDAAQRLWTQQAVQCGRAVVQIGADGPELASSPRTRHHRAARQASALAETLEVLDRLPAQRSAALQQQIDALVDALRPLADAAQRAELERIAAPQRAELEAAIADRDVAALRALPRAPWTRDLVQQLAAALDHAELLPLALDWARQEEAETCLREEGPLVWLLEAWLPPAPVVTQANAEPAPAHYLRACLRAWRRQSMEALGALATLQAALPLRTVDSVPIVLHLALFRCWSPIYAQPKKLYQLLRMPEHKARLAKAALLLDKALDPSAVWV
jgi:hypothetical protein